jgi:tetratricopeptide (TPR) repeat protein
MIPKLTAILLLLLFSLSSLAQDSLKTISGKDAGHMRSRAKKTLENLNNLFYNITGVWEQGDIDYHIKASYTAGERSRIFLDKNTLIREDIDPLTTTNIVAQEIPVSRYLSYLDLQYTKSKDPTIELKLLKTSFPRRGVEADTAYPFVRIFYTSHFTGKNKSKPDPYSTTNRYADIRMISENGIWKGYIESIGFFTAGDTVNTGTNDIPLFGDEDLNDTTANAKEKQLMIAEEQRQLEVEKKTRDQFNELIKKGDNALEAKDFTNCFIFYNNANEIIPGDPVFYKRIRLANEEKNAANFTKKNIAENYINDAKEEEIKRNYQEAVILYNKAIKENPELLPKYQAKIEELNKKWEVVMELQLKYNGGQISPKILIEDYTAAIKKNKENSDLYYGRARCYDKAGNIEKAIKDCDIALEKDPRNLPALKLRARLKRDSKDLYAAYADYTKYLAIHDADSSIYELKSSVSLEIKSGDYDKAINDLDEGIKVNDKWPNLHYRKGLLLLSKHDAKNAKIYFTNAIARKDVYADAYFQRGNAEMELNNMENAADDFRKAVDRNLDSSGQRAINDYAKTFYQLSIKNYSESKTDSALININKAIALFPANGQYHFKKGEYLLTWGKYQDAVTTLGKAVGLDANNAEAYYLRGRAYTGLQKWQEASKDYSKAIELNQYHLRARKELGDAYFSMDNFSKAAESYEGFLTTLGATKNPPEAYLKPDAHNSLGKSYLRQNASDERALENFKNAIKIQDNFAEAYYNSGNYYFKNKDFSNAIKNIETALKYNVNNPGWTYTLAKAYQSRGKEQDIVNAINYYNVTLNTDSLKTYPTVLYLLGTCYFKAQHYDNALANYLRVQGKGWDKVESTFNYDIGTTYLYLDKNDSAFVYLQKAFLSDSANERTMYTYAIALWRKNNPDEALRLFEKVLATGKIQKKELKNDELTKSFINDQRIKELLKK